MLVLVHYEESARLFNPKLAQVKLIFLFLQDYFHYFHSKESTAMAHETMAMPQSSLAIYDELER